MDNPIHVWHPKYWWWKALRWSITLIILYVVAEAWAQYRFNHSNPLMPSAMRKNIGIHPLDAFRLKPHFDDWSSNGLHYRTNELGFRIGNQPKKVASATSNIILLGGDSRIFGYALDYADTVSSQLEKNHDIVVHQQAFPGSSPAIFNVQIWDENLWKKLEPKPDVIIYGYDRDDIWNDQAFRREYQQAQALTWRSPRMLKVYLGGYLWNMANLKKKAFLSRSSWAPPWWDDWFKPEPVSIPAVQTQKNAAPNQPTGRSNPIGREALLELKEKSQRQKVPFVLMYLPRSLELLYDDPKMRNELRSFCRQKNIAFLDLYQEFSQRCRDNKSLVSIWFLDLQEGIHFSEQGNAIITAYIAKYLRSTP